MRVAQLLQKINIDLTKKHCNIEIRSHTSSKTSERNGSNTTIYVLDVTRSKDREQYEWIVRKEEVTMTEEVVGTGGWG